MGYNSPRSATVKTVHAYPHGTPSDGEAFTESGNDSGYRRSLAELTAIVATSGFILIFLHGLYRCFIGCGYCRWIKKEKQKKFKWKVLTFLALMGLIASMGSFVFAQSALTDSVDTVAEVIEDLQDLVGDFRSTLTEMVASADAIEAALGTITCPMASPVQPADYLQDIAEVSEVLEEFGDVLSDIEDPLEVAEKNVDKHAKRWVTYLVPGVIFSIFILVVAMTFSGLVASQYSPGLASSCLDAMACCTGSVILPAGVAILTIVFIINVALADFCFIGPAEVILAKSDKNKYLAYYLQCEGLNPLLNETNKIFRALEESTFDQAELEDNCAPAGDIAIVVAEYDSLSTNTDRLVNATDCSFFQPTAEKLFYEAICGHAVLGLYSTWVVIAAAGAATYLLLLFVPVTVASFNSSSKDFINLKSPFGWDQSPIATRVEPAKRVEPAPPKKKYSASSMVI